MANDFFQLDEDILQMAKQAEQNAKQAFAKIEEIAEYNSQKVLAAFIKNGISESHFAPTTGYGYSDRGRDTLDMVFADIFGAEDALVRYNFVSGTHAITTALFGILRPGDKMVSITGTPYDTLHTVIGLRKGGDGSLTDFGITYEQIELNADGTVCYEKIPQAVKGAKIAYIQRSRGYSLRPSLSVEEIAKIAKTVKQVDPNIIVMVDNCYGEFVQKKEPTQVGADIIIGSLIKNPGGGIAPTGGYIAGRKDLIELCAQRLTAPGIGREVGCTLGHNKDLYMGIFFAPSVVESALKTAIFAASMFSMLGYEVNPLPEEQRNDIIQTVKLGDADKLVAFCRGIQKSSAIDSFVYPEPWDMPGYDSKVIMAAGAFHMGASIELSADAPLREPYAVWMQGGLTYYSGKASIMMAAQMLKENAKQ